MTETRSTCPYCGVGCGVIIESQGSQITGVRGDPDHPANFGRLCSKGANLHLSASAEVTQQLRLLQPMYRAERKAAPQALGWDAAMDMAATRLADILQRHGRDAVGFYISGQLLTEDYYVFNKLVKGLIGSNHIDTNSRLCMSSAVAGYKQTLGADAPPCCYEDLELADCLFITGSNMAYAHPVLFRRIEQARAQRPQMKVICCDPRRTDTAAFADLHLALQPGTDVALFHGMLHIMLWEGWTRPDYIAAHTSGFEALKALVRDANPEKTSQLCGISRADLFEATRLFATSAATLSLYCQGLNQSSSGTAKNTALINLHLATAQIGRPGAGPFSLTGQPNAMGGREVGGMANLLSGHRDLANPQHRADVAALWGVKDVPAQPGKTAVEMFQAAADGEIKALWIACTNPAQSMPDQATVRRALERCEWVVVQEAFAHTATCDHADLLLPATTWGEKTGTVTNSERRISRVRPAVAAPGQARHDWRIAVDLAHRLEKRLGDAPQGLFPYPVDDAEAAVETIWNEHRESTRGRDLDISGLSYGRLEQPRQWPFLPGQSEGKKRLYDDGVFATPDGRARFVAQPYRAVAEACDARYPFALNTGRLRDQWHGMSRTGSVARLYGHVPEPALQLHPQDMARRQIHDGQLVRLSSRRGSVVVPAQPSADIGLSQAFLAMHWGGEYLGGHSGTGQRMAGVNGLSQSGFCPDSRQPELKHSAVRIEPLSMSWSLLAMAWLPNDSVWRVREALRPFMDLFPFASCVPFGRERVGVLLRAASHEPASDEVLRDIEALLGLNPQDCLHYADRQRGQRRTALLRQSGHDQLLEGLLLAGDTRAEGWLAPLLQQSLPVQAYGRQLLLPGAKPLAALPTASRQVCSCLNVQQASIEQILEQTGGSDSERLQALKSQLGCGTQCGSCVPQLQRLVRSVPLVSRSV